MKNVPFDGKAMWIWAEGADLPEAGSLATVARFSRQFCAPLGASLSVHVSADSRYVLWLNGQLVARGPAKGDFSHWPYDSIDLTGHLIAGANTLTALVVGFSSSWPDYQKGGVPVSLITAAPGFILDGPVCDAAGEILEDLATDTRWMGAACQTLHFAARPGVPCAGPGEEAQIGGSPQDDHIPREAMEVARGERPDTVADSCRPHRLIPRRIPQLVESPRHFSTAWDVSGFLESDAGNDVLDGKWVEVAAGTNAHLLLDVGTVTTGYPRLDVEGRGVVRVFYGERLSSGPDYVRDPSAPHERLAGYMHDQVAAMGGSASWEPVFWRTFRFVQLEVQALDTPLKIRLPGYTYTAYPYVELPSFQSSDPVHSTMDEIAWRTLRLCSHETFEDCPYYEQLQYAGDVQIQARTAYWMAGDTALSRQAMLQFAESINEEGLTASRYPSRVPQIIPLWSLHWVLSVGEYHDYTGDVETLRSCLRGMRRVVDWFLDRRDPNGLVGFLPYWKVADWCEQWSGGIPPGAENGASALVNFMTVAALKTVTTACTALRSITEAARLRSEAEKLASLSQAAFWDESSGLYRDRPCDPSEISQLTNAWAILSGVANPERARQMAEPLVTRNGVCEAAWFGKSFLFDALMAAGRPDLAERLLDPFRSLLDKGFTTWPESPDFGRSDCHGWSNLPGMAFRRLYLGVKSSTPGCRVIQISPWPGSLNWAKGVVPLPQGPLNVSWRQEGGHFQMDIDVPPDVTASCTLPDGRERLLEAGPNYIV